MEKPAGSWRSSLSVIKDGRPIEMLCGVSSVEVDHYGEVLELTVHRVNNAEQPETINIALEGNDRAFLMCANGQTVAKYQL
jgi:hypothetical protein